MRTYQNMLLFLISIDRCISQPLCITLNFRGSELQERDMNVLVKMDSQPVHNQLRPRWSYSDIFQPFLRKTNK